MNHKTITADEIISGLAPGQGEAVLKALKDAGYAVVPIRPSDGVLMSMAIRMDHALGVEGYYDNVPMFMRGPNHASHADRKSVALADARRCYEEVVGTGFYHPEKEKDYASLVKPR